MSNKQSTSIPGVQVQKANSLLDKLIFVSLDISLIGGRFQMTPDDVGINKSDLPPEDLASLGSMYSIPQESIKVGRNIKAKLKRLLETHGFKSDLGFAITEDKLNALVPEIKDLQSKFSTWKDTLVETLDELAQVQIDKNPEYKRSLIGRAPTKEYIDSQIDFGMTISKSTVTRLSFEIDGLAKSFDIAQSLLNSVSADIERFIATRKNAIAEGKPTSLTRKSIALLASNLFNRLSDYSFVSTTVKDAVSTLESVLVDVQNAFHGSHCPSQDIVGTLSLLKAYTDPSALLRSPVNDNANKPAFGIPLAL